MEAGAARPAKLPLIQGIGRREEDLNGKKQPMAGTKGTPCPPAGSSC